MNTVNKLEQPNTSLQFHRPITLETLEQHKQQRLSVTEEKKDTVRILLSLIYFRKLTAKLLLGSGLSQTYVRNFRIGLYVG